MISLPWSCREIGAPTDIAVIKKAASILVRSKMLHAVGFGQLVCGVIGDSCDLGVRDHYHFAHGELSINR